MCGVIVFATSTARVVCMKRSVRTITNRSHFFLRSSDSNKSTAMNFWSPQGRNNIPDWWYISNDWHLFRDRYCDTMDCTLVSRCDQWNSFSKKFYVIPTPRHPSCPVSSALLTTAYRYRCGTPTRVLQPAYNRLHISPLQSENTTACNWP